MMRGLGILPWAILCTLILTKSIKATLWIYGTAMFIGLCIGIYKIVKSRRNR